MCLQEERKFFMPNRVIQIRDSFGLLFMVSNTLETMTDRYLAPHKLTTKQFFLSLLLIQRGEPMSLTQTANLLGTSRQNVKQLALKLEKIGFCKIFPSPNDKRILYLEVTPKNKEFWKKVDKKNMQYLEKVFTGLTISELESLNSILKKLFSQISLNQEFQLL